MAEARKHGSTSPHLADRSCHCFNGRMALLQHQESSEQQTEQQAEESAFQSFRKDRRCFSLINIFSHSVDSSLSKIAEMVSTQLCTSLPSCFFRLDHGLLVGSLLVRQGDDDSSCLEISSSLNNRLLVKQSPPCWCFALLAGNCLVVVPLHDTRGQCSRSADSVVLPCSVKSPETAQQQSSRPALFHKLRICNSQNAVPSFAHANIERQHEDGSAGGMLASTVSQAGTAKCCIKRAGVA
jgi:hypothetical protein